MPEDAQKEQCMRHKGSYMGNATIENFFGLPKSEMLHIQELESVEHFKKELIEYLDFYNNKRIKTRLKVCHLFCTSRKHLLWL